MKKQAFFSARNIAYLAVLVALVIVLQLFASAIPMFGITLNFSLIPIVLAGILFGMWGGGFLGLVSGVITFLVTAVMGREPSTVFLFQAEPLLLTLVCIGKTTVAGFVAGLLYRLIARRSRLAAAYVAAAVVAVLNTGLYLLGIVLMKDAASAFLGTQASAQAVFIAVFGLIWLNSLLEIVVNVLIAPAISRVVYLAEHMAEKRGKDRSLPEDAAIKHTDARRNSDNAEEALTEQTDSEKPLNDAGVGEKGDNHDSVH